mmetsp:Transcript_26108/g.66454  ORF Transcript_26108/g.66454 Transcript_26108/m.66454 type:complete len:279 (-) Transcript_26108:229-1065(-)
MKDSRLPGAFLNRSWMAAICCWLLAPCWLPPPVLALGMGRLPVWPPASSASSRSLGGRLNPLAMFISLAPPRLPTLPRFMTGSSAEEMCMADGWLPLLPGLPPPSIMPDGPDGPSSFTRAAPPVAAALPVMSSNMNCIMFWPKLGTRPMPGCMPPVLGPMPSMPPCMKLGCWGCCCICCCCIWGIWGMPPMWPIMLAMVACCCMNACMAAGFIMAFGIPIPPIMAMCGIMPPGIPGIWLACICCCTAWNCFMCCCCWCCCTTAAAAAAAAAACCCCCC